MSSRKVLFTILVLASLLVPAISTNAQEKVQLSWITDLPGAEEVAARFTELNPNIEVRVDKVTFREVFQQNQIRLGSGAPEPDIVSVDAPVVASYGYRGWLLPLDDYFSQEQIDEWVDALYLSSLYNGQLLAPPIWNSTQVMYYNADLLKAAGITPPAPDERWTWEKVTEVARQVTRDENGDGVNDVWGLQFGQYNRIYQLQPIAQSLPAPVIGEDGLTVKGIIDSEEWIKAFTWFYDLHNTWKVSPQGSISTGELFRNGQLALYVDGGWMIGQFINDPLDFEWGAAPHPYWEGGEIKVPGDSWHLGVNPNSLHTAEAIEFVKFASSLEAGQIWYDVWGVWPAHEEMLEAMINDPANQDWPNLAFVVAANEAQYTEPRPLTVGYLEYEEILSDAFEDIRNGADVAETLSFAADRIEREMDKYRQ
ncbi:MAG: sugar ABC transporter substrate-binding protein [Anaerolineae bacterium]|nr:sugar ABC transporter substrate-binding protein [Anaerolineae bacterium]